MIDEQWHAHVNALSIEALRYEIHLREAELYNLGVQLSRMTYPAGRVTDDWEQSYEQALSRGAAGKHHDVSGYQSRKSLSDEIARTEARIAELKKENELIAGIIESRLREE